jgi:5-methyltetrahydrofolate--homocysteine methyltransferase
MLIIGETINASVKSVAEAIEKRDEDFIAALAKRQTEAGAEMLDVNAGSGGRNQIEDIRWLLDITQKTVETPLVLDSDTPEVLIEAFPHCKHRPMLSSITLEEHSLKVILPFIKDHDFSLLGMCLGSKGIPNSAEQVFELAKELIDRTTEAGLKPSDLYLDVAVVAIAVNVQAGKRVLDSIRMIKDYQPDVHIVCAVSNISFGLPKRRLLNRTYLPMISGAGADTFILDVRDAEMMASITATNALLGNDPYCMKYVKAYRAGKF